MSEKLIFELSKEGRCGFSLPEIDVPTKETLIPDKFRRDSEPSLPEVSEVDVVRHFTKLSLLNYHVDFGFYPLGSCTMKYNPKINEKLSRLSGFTAVHPHQLEETVQGSLQLMYELGELLCEIAGLDEISLQPAAGAHGELTGVMIIRVYHEKKGHSRSKILIPDSSHGTNPASVTLSGYKTVQIKSNENGLVDLVELKKAMDEDVAGMMLTNPNTLGLFETNVVEICNIVHEKGGLMYMDGANLNALCGISRPGDVGFDIVHFNLHKTFSTPHGGGGPGSGPLGVKKELAQFLPLPLVRKDNGKYSLVYDRKDSIGKIHSFFGNFGVMVKAYAYLRMMGEEGLKEMSECAILNANYIKKSLENLYFLPYTQHCMHECVFSGRNQKEKGIRTLDIAKRLLDFGVHAPTIYFPLIVPEALMIEPTETESKESCDQFIDAMIKIAKEPTDVVKGAPHSTVVKRLDEVKAAKDLKVKY